MIDWREVREITLVILGALAFGVVGVALMFGAYVLGALLAPAVGYVLVAVTFLVYEVTGIYVLSRKALR